MVMTWEEAVKWCLDQPERAELARDAYFGDPVEAAERYHRSAEWAEVRKWLRPANGRALDLGAGNGIVSWALAKDGWDVVAVEPDPSELVGAGAIRATAERSGVAIRVIEAFGERIPLDEAEFDVVIARQVLHHAKDLPAFCREIARLARPGATIVTLRDHVVSGRHQLPEFFKTHPLHFLYGGENAYTLEQYRSALEAAGLAIVREMRSFESVVNYDPLTPAGLRERLAELAGPARAPVHALLKVVPFAVIRAAATFADRRPGRLVSYLCRRAD
ncbi:MAG: class I SAM-dependent methyltransferase [Croceibacterium sp.]